VKASYDVADGRLHVQPFVVKVSGIDMTVAGSNGIDQSLTYDVSLAVPRALLGGAAGNAVATLASQAGKAGADLAAGETVQLGAQITGTVTNPMIKPSLAGLAGSARDAAKNVAQEELATRTAAVKQRADSAANQARVRARAKADGIVAEATRQADTIRAKARTLAAATRREGSTRADSLQVRATNPMARIAAQAAADRMRREADQQAERIVREADARADGIVAQAKRQADGLVPP
jgi:vacuolar-type H+-ATPase subunit H